MPDCKCGKAAAKDCPNGQCGDCCSGCPRHDKRIVCECCECRIDGSLCEKCWLCDDCCDCTRCPNCGRIDYESLCDHLADYCDICDGLDNVAVGIGYVCDSCANGLHIGWQDNLEDEGGW